MVGRHAAQATVSEDAMKEGLSIGEWVAVCPEQEPVFLQGILNANVEADSSPMPSGSILVCSTLA